MGRSFQRICRETVLQHCDVMGVRTAYVWAPLHLSYLLFKIAGPEYNYRELWAIISFFHAERRMNHCDPLLRDK